MIKKFLLIGVVVAVLALVVRLPGLGTFMTADEEQWMLRSATFWHEVLQGNLGGTFLTTHPGATAMWIVGVGIVYQENQLGYAIDTSNIRDFRLAATLPMVVTLSSLIGVVALVIGWLVGRETAVMAGVLLAVEPYLVGMSQIAHLDMLLALLMLLAMLFLLVSLTERRPFLWLLGAGVATGLAMGVKTLPALWLWVVFAAVYLVQYRRGLSFRYGTLVRKFLFVAGAALLTLVTVWPTLIVKNDWWRSVEHDAVSVVTQEHVAFSEDDNLSAPASFYLHSVISRLSPFTLILAVGAAITMVRFIWRVHYVSPTAWLAFYAIGYVMLISLAAKKADRYTLPALVVIVVLAGWALVLSWFVVQSRWPRVFDSRWRFATMGIVGISLLGQLLIWSPYVIAYINPLVPVPHITQQGWGEGLDEAARRLNQHPLIDKLSVASWYPSVFATYFNGKTFSLSSRHDERIGFVVLYRNMQGRGEDTIASNVLEEFRDKTPIFTVDILDTPYVWVYDTIGLFYFDQHSGELTSEMEVGQTVKAPSDNWQKIDIGMVTFSGRENTHDVILHVRESVNSESDIRTVRINASDIRDSDWQSFVFKSIKNSGDKNFYVAITSPTSVPGNAIGVRFAGADILPGEMMLRRRALREGENNTMFLRSDSDLAYRF